MQVKRIVSLSDAEFVHVGYVYNDNCDVSFEKGDDKVVANLPISKIKRLHEQLTATIKRYDKDQLEEARKALDEEAQV